MGLEDKSMTLIHFGPVQLEVFSRASACEMVPAIGKQDPAHIYK